ncbi:hypothetical protein V2J09_005119 [Rumex salicifolius]
MALNLTLRYRQLRRVTKVLPLSFSGIPYHGCRPDARISAPPSIPMSFTWEKICPSFAEAGLCTRRFSTVAEISQDPAIESDFMSFIEAAFDQVKGPYHCWLNKADEHKTFFKNNGIFLLLVGISIEDLQKTKFLQQRCPWIQVFAIQSVSENHSSLTQLIMKEYINFPVLLSNKTFPEMTKGPCYVLFKGFENPQLYHGKDMDFEILQRDIKNLHAEVYKNRSTADKLKSSWSKESDYINEPYFCSSLRNLLLYYPACISGDESKGKFFLSDSNHHRVIIFDGHGKIFDLIGSSPGFEDGEFDTAKLMRPAGSFYNASEGCLYFVDSENHAIRRADMEKRVVETVYPTSKDKEKGGVWTWIMNKLGMRSETKTKSDEFDSEALMFPWHLIKSKEDDDLLIMNKSCDTLWVMNLDTLVINQVIRGSQNILDTYGGIIEEVSTPENLSHSQVQSLIKSFQPSDRNQYDGLLSSFATSGNCLLVCDKVGHRVLKFDTTTDAVSSHEFTNFGILGLPYWLSCSLERVFPINDTYMELHPDHAQSFTLLPGKVDIELNIDIPSTTMLVETLQEGCVWRQVRGSAVEMSGLESIGTPPEKVGVSQQWYDELDNLAFSQEQEISEEEEKEVPHEDLSDDRIHIDCCVSTSPGTSEVIIFAALYLKLKKNPVKCDPKEKAAMIADILKPERSGKMNRDAFIELLLSSDRDLDDLVFTKALHVRIQLRTHDHPKDENSKNISLTDSKVKVDVSL